MKLAVAAFASQKMQKMMSQTRMLLACAAQLKPQKTELWLLGDDDNLPGECGRLPVEAIYHIKPDNPQRIYLTGEWIPALMRLYDRHRPQAILFYDNIAGNELAVRVGVRTGGSFMTEAASVSRADNGLVVSRSAYGSNLTAAFELNTEPYVISIAKGAYDPIHEEGKPEWFISAESISEAGRQTDLLLHKGEAAEDGLEAAQVVVAGGRGLGNKENMERLRRLAALLNGRLGGTRPAVLDGWLKHKYLIGASGNVVRPKLCLAMGVSGAGPFMAGVEKSERLVAVNNDPDALIFKYCDIGIVEDCRAVARELEQILLDLKPRSEVI